MTQSNAYRTKRDLVAQWLLDAFDAEDTTAYGKYWREAADLIKFLKANGFEIRAINAGQHM